MEEKSYLYFHYYDNTIKDGYLFSWFYKNYKESVFYVYVRYDLDIKNIIPKRIFDYTYEVSAKEENLLLNDMTLKGKQGYSKLLIKLGFEKGYRLYKIYKTKEFINELFKTKDNGMNKSIDYRSYSNRDESILYIILRNDLGLTPSEQLVYSSQMAIKMAIKMSTYIDYNNFFRLFDNIVILQASKKDLFEDNFIPTKYNNPNIVFDYHTNEEIRVAHNNFKLDESKIVALGYYGIKKDMPKWIKKLQLYK